jgi:hypothetical protein
MERQEIESAARVLLAARVDGREYGRLTRYPSGELQLVCAIRGEAAKAFLTALGESRRQGWATRLLECPGPWSDER